LRQLVTNIYLLLSATLDADAVALQVIAALKTGASLLKSQQPDVEQVHDTMNDVAEALEENREIETALAQSMFLMAQCLCGEIVQANNCTGGSFAFRIQERC
jgi:hypothetical protein